MLKEDKIESNYNTFLKLCKSTNIKQQPDRAEKLLHLLEHFGDRLVLCPASSKERFHAAYPGGLVDHSLRVLANAQKICKSFGYKIDSESLIMACLFHDFGKIGDLTDDYYEYQDNEWRRDNLGEFYKINYDMQKMPNAERGLWLLQHFGVYLTLDEWIAIRTNDGPIAEENRYYMMHEPTLALIVQTADRHACQEEKAMR